MKHKKLISILTLGALAVAAVFGAIVYRTAKAAAPAQAANLGAATPVNGFGNGARGGYTNQDLATALGITVDQLNTAYQTANQAALKQAVTQGLITQAQADEINAHGAAFPLGVRWSDWLTQKGIDFDTFLADALGITADKLQAAYIQAFNTRIDQAVTNGNLTQAQADLMKGQNALNANKAFQTAMQSAFENAVKQAVTDGVITQAQADQILANGSGMNFAAPRGMNGPEGFGPQVPGAQGGRGPRGGNPNNNTNPGASTSAP